eukprot:EC794659.1.p1 GENE.EC794659.1~~EC794659.1.p1  ORF type:complete len:164 (+),score=72.13 EC794659.1:32-493(+)
MTTEFQLVPLEEPEVIECKEAFALFDRDADGFISIDDLAIVMRSLGTAPTTDELKKFCTENQTIRDRGLVSFDEFLLLMRYKLSEVESDDYIVEAFRHLDSENSGYCSSAEIRHIFKNIGDKMTDAEIDDMFQEAGVEGSLVSFEEFMRMMSR